jgi:hypothetical protein
MENGFIEAKSAEVIRKAWTDQAYRGELKRDPGGVIVREFGVELPAGTEVRVLEDGADSVHLVLVEPDHIPECQRTTPRGLLVAKAWHDPAFRQALLADPKAAASAALGVDFPAGFKLTVLEQTDNPLYVVIPFRPPALSDADLDKVAGGTGFFKEAWKFTREFGEGFVEYNYNGAKNAVENEFWYDTSGSQFALADQLAYHGGKYAGKELYKGGKKAYHAIKKICHGW